MGAPGRHAERNRWPAISSCRPLISSFHRSKPCPVPRYGGENPRTIAPRKNVIRDTPNYLRTATAGPTSSLVRKQCCSASIVPRNPTNLPYRHSGESRNPEGWGEGIVAPGLVPRLGHDSSLLHVYRPAIPPKSNRPGWGPGKPSPWRPIRYTGPSIRHSRGGGNPRTLASHTHGTRETGIHAHKEPQAQAPRIHSHRLIS